ncbi:hypothetical protein JHC09_12240 [Devosia sp. MC532]|uniref:hypothetical protein n=1 Tax=Devosia sp. MC532 TaxID=2799788 RepID=UPI0018F6E0C8|nr:hypothetical protein [Devosia sp. MC532]MBJ7578650.1 hypothetical protein [Devosia sp. MC532]
MPHFLAVYTMTPEDLDRFRERPEEEQNAVDDQGLPAWEAWEKTHAAMIVDKGGMVGGTLRASGSGIAPARNDICGYIVVEAETIDAAAAIFADHPHFAIFPGSGVDIMPFVTPYPMP